MCTTAHVQIEDSSLSRANYAGHKMFIIEVPLCNLHLTNPMALVSQEGWISNITKAVIVSLSLK